MSVSDISVIWLLKFLFARLSIHRFTPNALIISRAYSVRNLSQTGPKKSNRFSRTALTIHKLIQSDRFSEPVQPIH